MIIWSIFLSNDNVEVKYLPSPLLLCFKIKVEFVSKEIARKGEEKKAAKRSENGQSPGDSAGQGEVVGKHGHDEDPACPVAEVEANIEGVEVGEEGNPLDGANDPKDGQDGGDDVDGDLHQAAHKKLKQELVQGAFPHVEAEDKPAELIFLTIILH